jgi:hypothetical protein
VKTDLKQSGSSRPTLFALLGRLSGATFGCLLLAVAISNVAVRDESHFSLADNHGSGPKEDSLYEVALAYAPFIYHATDRSFGRQDLISNIDFDGDLVGNNNWENFARYKLIPTVYYAVLETETHYFMSYHLFHPRDWSHITFWVNDTHENDGENLQIVVRKRDRRVVLLWTQAHYDSRVYNLSHSEIESAQTEVRGEFQTVNSTGELDESGRHAAVFVESQGHGIYGTLDSSSEVKLSPDGSYAFDDGTGLLFRPAKHGESVAEPRSTTSGQYPYQLDSIQNLLWPLLRDGLLTGNGRLLDGAVPYVDQIADTREVPRYYDADRFSGPLGKDRGISPFAMDFSFDTGSLGSLFFNPAKRYSERLKLSGEWSLNYIGYPYGESDTAMRTD